MVVSMAEERSAPTVKQETAPGRSNTEKWLWVVGLVAFIAVYQLLPRIYWTVMVEDPGARLSTKGQIFFWTIYVIAWLVEIVAIIRLAYDYQWLWNIYQRTGFRGKSLWDWLQLLIVPAVLAAGGYLFSHQQEERQQAIEDERAQEIAYQAYIDQMSQLLTEEDLSVSPDEEVRTVARAQTLNVLVSVEDERKMRVLQFLADNDLVQGDNPTVNLQTADFVGAKLIANERQGASGERVNLTFDDVNLSKTQLDRANLDGIRLRNASLNGAIMYDAILIFADLQEASLVNAYIIDADMRDAHLVGANFGRAYLDEADLSQASLVGADFGSADLANTCLVRADLRGANLEDAEHLTAEQLERAFGDENTTLPEGIERPSAWSNPIEQQHKDEGFNPDFIGIREYAPCGSF
jgi:uncharacterized protein YjbI with pentapeptide repeats